MGQQNSARPALPPVPTSRRPDPRLNQSRGQEQIEIRTGAGERSTEASTRDGIKIEDDGDGEPGRSTRGGMFGGGGGGGGGGGSRAQHAGMDGGITISDDEEEKGFYVDSLNNLFVDDSDEDMVDAESGDPRQTRHLRPIRLDRKPHVDRQVGLNTAISAAASDNDAGNSRPQTYEEQLEERIRDEKVQILFNEFGAKLSLKSDQAEPEQQQGERAFLVQLPPTMPELIPVGNKVKQERPSSKSPERRRDENTAKQSSGTDSEPSNAPSNGRRLRFPSGKVGTLRLYEDGRREMKWGDVDMTVKVGHDVGFLQSLVMTGPAADEGRGVATSFGTVRGKLVLTMNLDKVLPSENRAKT